MKHTFVRTIALLLAVHTQAQDRKELAFTIHGKIDDVGVPAKVILHYSRDGKRAADTVELSAGAFAFKGAIDKPMQAIVIVEKSTDDPRMRFAMGYAGEIIGRDGVSFYLDKGAISIQGKTLKDAAISGSAAQKDYEAYKAMQKPVTDRLAAINEEMKPYYKDRESEAYKDLEAKLLKTMKELGPVRSKFISSHPNSWVAWNLLTSQSIITDLKATEAQFKAMNAKFRSSEDGKKFLERLKSSAGTAIGAVAPNFTQSSPDGTPISLASLRGKYVLIDFWASWCGPCRAENPNVVKAYQKFKGPNFEILAVSLDSKKDAWEKAIADDHLPWLHVSDLKGWENAVAKLYNVRAVPQNWLVDPKGVIIAANMRGKELEEKLSALLPASTVTIKGTLNGDTKGYNKIYIYGKDVKSDSVVMVNGAFEFSIPFEKPFMPLFYTEYDRNVKRMYSPFPLLIEKPGTVQLTDGDITKGMSSLKVSGLQSAVDFDDFRQQHLAVYKKVNEQLQARYGKGWVPDSDPQAAAINKDREAFAREGLTAVLDAFVSKHPGSYAAAMALSNYGRSGIAFDDLKRIFAKLSKERQRSDEGQTISGYIAGVNNSAIGKEVADFTLSTPEDQPFRFSQLKGKYVLIDFWASWCGPCKASFPHMKEVYNKFKGDKFEIYSISIDTDKDAWLAELKRQQLPWVQALDTRRISQSGFAVTAVPSTFLIGPDGKILMKEVGFDSSGNGKLEKKITELLSTR